MTAAGLIYLFVFAIEAILYALLVPLIVFSRPFVTQQSGGISGSVSSSSSSVSGGGGGGGISFPSFPSFSLGLDVDGQLENNPFLFASFPGGFDFTTIEPPTDSTDDLSDVITTTESSQAEFGPFKIFEEVSVSDALKDNDGTSMSVSEALASLTNPDGSIKVPDDLEPPNDEKNGETKNEEKTKTPPIVQETKNTSKSTKKFIEKFKSMKSKNQAKKKVEITKKKNKKNLFDVMKEKFAKSKRKNDRQFQEASRRLSFFNKRKLKNTNGNVSTRHYM